MAYNRSSDRDTGSSSFGRSSSGGGFGGGGGSSRSSGGGGGGGGSLRGADGMTASQRAATRDSRLGLTTGTTWRGNTAVGPAGGRATGFTNVRTGGGRMTKTQRDAVGPGTMPRVTSGQPSRSRVTAQPTSGPRPMVKKVRPAAKKPAVKKPSVRRIVVPDEVIPGYKPPGLSFRYNNPLLPGYVPANYMGNPTNYKRKDFEQKANRAQSKIKDIYEKLNESRGYGNSKGNKAR